jgi:hypothetical protein
MNLAILSAGYLQKLQKYFTNGLLMGEKKWLEGM